MQSNAKHETITTQNSFSICQWWPHPTNNPSHSPTSSAPYHTRTSGKTSIQSPGTSHLKMLRMSQFLWVKIACKKSRLDPKQLVKGAGQVDDREGKVAVAWKKSEYIVGESVYHKDTVSSQGPTTLQESMEKRDQQLIHPSMPTWRSTPCLSSSARPPGLRIVLISPRAEEAPLVPCRNLQRTDPQVLCENPLCTTCTQRES